jgi:hypothetical protein
VTIGVATRPALVSVAKKPGAIALMVIVRPGMLTDGPATKNYVKPPGPERVSRSWSSSISRADLADFLVEAAEVDTWVGKGVQTMKQANGASWPWPPHRHTPMQAW